MILDGYLFKIGTPLLLKYETHDWNKIVNSNFKLGEFTPPYILHTRGLGPIYWGGGIYLAAKILR
jgi:hypothetical protein